MRRLRYIAISISRKQGSLFADGEAVKHFCVVTNRDDPEPIEPRAGDVRRRQEYPQTQLQQCDSKVNDRSTSYAGGAGCLHYISGV